MRPPSARYSARICAEDVVFYLINFLQLLFYSPSRSLFSQSFVNQLFTSKPCVLRRIKSSSNISRQIFLTFRAGSFLCMMTISITGKFFFLSTGAELSVGRNADQFKILSSNSDCWSYVIKIKIVQNQDCSK